MVPRERFGSERFVVLRAHLHLPRVKIDLTAHADYDAGKVEQNKVIIWNNLIPLHGKALDNSQNHYNFIPVRLQDKCFTDLFSFGTQFIKIKD